MDRRAIYVANLSKGVAAEQLAALFGEHGEVENVELTTHSVTGAPVALVTMRVEREATRAINDLNGRDLDGRRLAVSYPEVDLSKNLTSKQRKVAEAIAADLGETEKVPLREIHMLVRLCGPAFARAIAEEAKAIHAGEGIMRADGSARRTVGGVFFLLARDRMALPVRRIVLDRKGKPPKEGSDAVVDSP